MSNLSAIEHDLVLPDLTKYLSSDGQPGYPVGFHHFNELYTHKQGGVTDWTGFPGSGKTYYALETLMGLSEKNGKRHGLFVPDIGSNNEVLQKLIKMRTGKDFNNKYHNKITEAEMLKELPWIMHHFVIFKKKDFKKGVTPLAFWEMVCEYKDDAGVLDTGLADSWKNFKHIYNGREDSYLDEMLSIRNEMSEDYQKHLHTIAHAVKTELEDAKNPLKKGIRRIPNAWDIKGGGSWYANGKNIITADFPNKNDTFIDLYVSKVKPEDVGRVGSVVGKIKLNQRKGRYFEIINNKECYAYEYEKIDMTEHQRQAQIDFSSILDNSPPPF